MNLITRQDAISRQAVIEAAEKLSRVDGAYGYMDAKSIVDMIESLPPVEPERKTGRWIGGKDERFVKCSECGMETTKNQLLGISLFGEDEPNYCPNGGAKMESD